jgi:hypothetical protein
MRPGAALLLVLAGWAAPANATGEIVCGDGKGVSVDMLVGHVEVLSISRILVDIGDKSWSTQPDLMPGTLIAVGQAFEDDRQLAVDIIDETFEVLGRLRVFKATEGDVSVLGGVFSFKDEGAFVVDCSDPQ